MSKLAFDWSRFFRFVCVSVLGAWCAAAADAAESRRHFDLPAGEAALTLPQFSEESGREILFASDVVRGVHTGAVRGEFTTPDALQQMLTGTSLYALQDPRTGAFAVRKRSNTVLARSPSEPAPELRPSSDDPTPTMKNRKTAFALLGTWLLSALTPSPAAQSDVIPRTPTAAEVNSGQSPAPSEEAVVLSAFQVSAERDRGYQATSTLAGTRLRSELKDLAPSISVVTKEFMEDINRL